MNDPTTQPIKNVIFPPVPVDAGSSTGTIAVAVALLGDEAVLKFVLDAEGVR